MKNTLLLSLLLATASSPALASVALAQKYTCTACHATDRKVVGPSYQDVARRYAADKGAEAKLAARIKSGGAGNWGPVPMPPNPAIPDADLKALAKWILGQK